MSNNIFGCPRSWSSGKCQKCWPNIHYQPGRGSYFVSSCPPGWCKDASNCDFNECKQDDCPNKFGGTCIFWGKLFKYKIGDCCAFSEGGRIDPYTVGGCGLYTNCPRSWSEGKCERCYPRGSGESIFSKRRCPSGWCQGSNSECRNWSTCARSECPILNKRFASFNICDNWGNLII
jgi:hypothetical protein